MATIKHLLKEAKKYVKDHVKDKKDISRAVSSCIKFINLHYKNLYCYVNGSFAVDITISAADALKLVKRWGYK